MKHLFHKVALLIFLTFFKIIWQQSAELDELQKLCPNVRGIYCTHCSHKSVEQICPIECRFCGGSGGGGFGGFRSLPLRQGAGIPGPIEARGIGTMLPQNLGVLRRQCNLMNGICGMCKIPSISELCVDECLKCENGGGILPTNIGEGQNDDLFGDELLSNELKSSILNGFDNSNGDPTNLLEIFQQLQKMEQKEEKIMSANGRRNILEEEDVGAEQIDEEEEDGNIGGRQMDIDKGQFFQQFPSKNGQIQADEN